MDYVGNFDTIFSGFDNFSYSIKEGKVSKQEAKGDFWWLVKIVVMKTSWVFDIANGAVSILNQNGHWHKKLNRGILEVSLVLAVEMWILRRCLLHQKTNLRWKKAKHLRQLIRYRMEDGIAQTVGT